MNRFEHKFLSEDTVLNTSLIFKALADPTRIKILYLLSQEECSVKHIAEVLEMSQSAVSHQLSYLRNMRLITYRREGQTLIYTYNDEHVITLLKQAIEHAEH
ncbi:ArsR/SmtB family transcription factor [Cohnella thermotolerans]|uniref:ArsR/SmtB family transcription factor n=1 Tax=Cohnella thermotolerans TaxID=329858 RepID=UPI0004268598|nr:metalloregulator ArsR/SmtB family transcription factor [Cohnella thermotolerans]